MNKRIIGLLTDFGNDFAVGSIRGVILNGLPDCTLVDIDHTVDKFNIVSAAFIIEKTYRFYPKGTIFICVIDPGVGTQREAMYLHADGYHFFGPNNGIFHYLIKQATAVQAYLLDTAHFDVSLNTFHGRDLFAPAAVRFAQGKRDFLKPLTRDRLITLPQLDTDTVIAFIDSFGNIKTNIPFSDQFIVNELYAIAINNITAHVPLVTTFGDVAQGSLLVYRGSNNTLEVAVHAGSAAHYFNAKAGDRVDLVIASDKKDAA